MNLVFTESGLTTELRVKFSQSFTRNMTNAIYFEQDSLLERMFIAMTSENFVIKFDTKENDDALKEIGDQCLNPTIGYSNKSC